MISKSVALIYIKRIWIVSISIAVFWYIAIHWADIFFTCSQISNKNILLSLIFILVGKFLCVYLVYLSLILQCQFYPVTRIANWYSSADMGKYLPGGIWPIVGRMAAYKKSMRTEVAIKAFLIETIFIIVIPIIFALCFVASSPAFGHSLLAIILSILFFVATLIVVFVVGHQTLSAARKNFIFIKIIISQSICWIVLFPLSLYLLMNESVNYFEVIVAFDAGFAVGQLAIFAPSGVGVREVVFGYFINKNNLMSFLNVMMVHRVVWFFADIFFFILSKMAMRGSLW
jgi:hypothetical protein